MALHSKRTPWTRNGILAGAVLLAVVVLGFRALMPPKVTVARVERRPLVQKVVANGRVNVPVRVQIGSQTGGVVARMLVDKGDTAAAGQLLAELAHDEQAAVVAQAEARLQQVRELDLPGARQDLRQAEVTLRQAERQFVRAQSLGVGGGVADEEIEAARDERDLAASRRESAAARVRGYEPGGSLEKLAVAELAAARAQLEQTRITAPSAGTILQRLAQPGDVVVAGAALLDLAPDGPTWLAVQPEEKNLAFLRVGQEAQASADAYPDSVFAARVQRVAPSVDPARGTIEVELIVDRPPSFLRPDMTVSIDVEVARNPSALVLPADAVRDIDGTPWVLVVAGGRAERRAVVLGLWGAGMLEIRSGLIEGDAVVPPEAARIREGARVRVASGDRR